MKYLMKQKFFSFKQDFYIKNAHGQEAYFVDAEFFTIGFKCKLYDMQNHLKYAIREKLFTLLSDYYIYDANGEEYAIVNQKFTFFKLKINVSSRIGNVSVEGDFFDWNYSIYVNNQLAAVVSRELFTFTDTYTVDVTHEDEAFILSLVCIIDNIIDKRRNNN
ncbi:MAG TPA: hypothetical protein DCY20_00450 [Firmicutes bacterium]|nr:hypothetical protein [Bacillota bacterium]